MQIEFTPRGILGNIFRQGTKVSILFISVLAIGVLYIGITKPIYEASGSVLVKFGHDTPEQIANTSDSGPSVISQDDRREIMQSDMDILQSHDLIASVVKEIGPENIYPGITKRTEGRDLPDEAVLRKLTKGDLIIKAAQFSNVIDIKMDNENPEIAARFVHRLMETFIAKQNAIYNNAQSEFLQDQAKQAAAKLEASQKALETYKEEKGISSINDEIAELLRQRSDAGTAALETSDSAWDKVSDLESEEKKLLATFRPDSPQVQRVHQSVLLAKEQLRERQEDLKARTGSTSTRLNHRIAELEGKRKEYDQLAMQVDIDEKNYKSLQARAEDALLNDKLSRKNITSIAVVDEPIVPLKPAYPRRMLILAISLLAGSVTSLGGALLFETYDQRFTTPGQLTNVLGIPVMAVFNA